MLDVVVPLLSKLPVVPPDGKRPSLYAAENDHNVSAASQPLPLPTLF